MPITKEELIGRFSSAFTDKLELVGDDLPLLAEDIATDIETSFQQVKGTRKFELTHLLEWTVLVLTILKLYAEWRLVNIKADAANRQEQMAEIAKKQEANAREKGRDVRLSVQDFTRLRNMAGESQG